MFLTKIAEKTGLLNILAPRNTNTTEEPGDAALAQKLWKEEKILFKRLETQKEKEEEAETRGAFIKQQRVKYHHKASDAYYDAVIIGVHFDDGPDRPYYTIKYKKPETDENGAERADFLEIEKQTTVDRLERVKWNEDASRLLFTQDKTAQR
eukprot:scaffold5469_cov54-Attheya_sp.AAC.2